MQKKVLGGVFLLLFIGLGVFLYKLLDQKIELHDDTASYESPQKQTIKPDVQNHMWIKAMAEKDTQEFTFPVNELLMQIDQFGIRDSNGKKAKSFRLMIDRADRYSLFCIIQTLTALHLPYMVVKEGKIPIIYIEEKSDRQLENVVIELEKYDIKSKIVEVL